MPLSVKKVVEVVVVVVIAVKSTCVDVLSFYVESTGNLYWGKDNLRDRQKRVLTRSI